MVAYLERFYQRRNINLLLSLIVFILGLASIYAWAPVGIYSADEPYQIMVARYYKDAPMAFMSGFLGHLWGSAFGWKLLTMRYYAIAVQFFALMCCIIFMWKRSKNISQSLLAAGLCAFYLSGMLTSALVGWDATSNCMLTLLALTLINYMLHPSGKGLVVLSLCTSITIFTRLPNIVCVPCIALFLLYFLVYSEGRKRAMLYSALYLVLTTLFAIGIICAFYGSIGDYAKSISENAITDHSAMRLIKYYYLGALNLLPCMCFFWSIYLMIQVSGNYIKSKRIVHAIVMILIIIMTQYVRVKYLGGIYNIYIWGCYAYFLLLLVYSLIIHTQNNGTKSRLFESKYGRHGYLLIPIILLIFSLIPVVGSNAGYGKFNSIILLPVLLSVTVCSFNSNLRRYTFVMVIVMCVFAVCFRLEHSFKDVGFRLAKSKIDVELLSGIKTTKTNSAKLELLNGIIAENKNSEIIFASAGFNYERFMGYYLNNAQPQYHRHSWENESCDIPDFISKTLHKVKNRHVATSVIIMNVGELKTTLEKELIKLNPYKIEQRNDIRVYQFL